MQNSDVISLWRKVLAGVHAPVEEEHALKELIATGISLNRGRHQNLLPDELTTWLRDYYSSLNLPEKGRLFQNLATVFSLDVRELDEAVGHWQALKDRQPEDGQGSPSNDEALLRAAERLYQASQPLYSRLWTPLAQQSDGLSFLVDLRGDLLRCIDAHPAGAAQLRAMAEGLRRTLAGWFSIAAEERVHSIPNWLALKTRLGSDRRVFAWTHPSLPGEPLVALYVALCSSLPGTMDEILGPHGSADAAEETPEQKSSKFKNTNEESEPACSTAPTTAVFYSISSMKHGLSGVDLGNNLIKRASKELLAEVPSLTTLATLSPIPGLSSWLQVKLARAEQGLENDPAEPLLLEEEKVNLQKALNFPPNSEETAHLVLREALKDNAWVKEPVLEAALRGPLLRLAAQYLLQVKHRGKALDGVANFHLRNGACVHRLNWRGDLSTAGLSRSHGIMVNYLYDMEQVEENNKRYVVHGDIAASKQVKQLLKEEKQ